LNFAKENPQLTGLSVAAALGTGYLTQQYISNKISDYRRRKLHKELKEKEQDILVECNENIGFL